MQLVNLVMLKDRVVTAVVIATVFFGTLLALPAMYFYVLCALVIFIAAWEWAALAGINAAVYRLAFTLLTILLLMLALHAAGFQDAFGDIAVLKILLATGCGFWAAMFYMVAVYPRSQVLLTFRIVRVVMGLLALVAAGTGLVYLRSLAGGEWWIVYVVSVVAVADIGAYFTGRALGTRKLAPAVSPGKSWEGFWGGFVLVQLFAAACYRFADQCLFSGEGEVSFASFALAAAILSSISVLGDLFESMLKRHAGIKDSGAILPGHGGVLDRIDGLLAALPLMALCVLSLQW